MDFLIQKAHIDVIVPKCQRKSQTLRQVSINDVDRPEDALPNGDLGLRERIVSTGTAVETHLEDQAYDDSVDTRSSVESQHGNEKELDSHCGLNRLDRGSVNKHRLNGLD